MSTIALGTGHTRSVPGAPLRLTHRGRVVVTLVFLGLVLAAFAVVANRSTATGTPGRAVPTRTVVVQPGDTLWSFAADIAEPGKIREVVHEIEELNALPGPALTAGQEIALPLG